MKTKSRLHAYIGSIRQLEILLAVYDGGSIKSAGEQLHLTQPTVSMQLKKLAESIGMPIYDQVGKKIVFTQAGLALVSTAREVLESFDRLDMWLSDLRGLRAGKLSLAVVTTSKYFIPHLLGPFCKRYPQVDIRFEVGNRESIIKRLEEGSDDLYVFSHAPENDNIESRPFLPNPLVAIAHKDHPLAGGQPVSLTQLLEYTILVREAGSGTRYAIEQHLKQHDLKLSDNMTIASNEAIIHSVMEDLGVAILSAHTLNWGQFDNLVRLKVETLPIETSWYIVWPKNKRLSVIASTFVDYVEQEGRENLISRLSINNLPTNRD